MYAGPDRPSPNHFSKKELHILWVHLLVQLLNGCSDAQCTTSTCYTYRQHRSSAPLRRYNKLTARYIALVIASRLDAHSWVCPHVHVNSCLESQKLLEGPYTIDNKSLAQQLCLTSPIDRLAIPVVETKPDGVLTLDDFTLQALHKSSDCSIRAFAAKLTQLVSGTVPVFSRQDLQHLNLIVLWLRHESGLAPTKLPCPDLSALRCLADVAISDVESSYERILDSIFGSHHVLLKAFHNLPPVDHSSSVRQPLDDTFRSLRIVPRHWTSVCRALNDSIFEASQTWHDLEKSEQNIEKVSIIVFIVSSLMSAAVRPCLPKTMENLLISDLPLVISDAHPSETKASRCSPFDDDTRAMETILFSFAGNIPADQLLAIIAATTCRIVEEQHTAWNRTARCGPSINWLTYLRAAFFRHWNGRSRISLHSKTWIILMWMRSLWMNRLKLELSTEMFHIRSVHKHLDLFKTVSAWSKDVHEKAYTSILRFDFIFDAPALVEHFRAICSARMRDAFSDAEAATALRQRTRRYLQPGDETYLDRRMKVASQHHLVLKISRENVLRDAFDQLWQREYRELLRPLRVRLGMDEGEIGHDFGGVQVEFFNLAFSEAFRDQHSIFVVDQSTQLAWLRPGSLEPLYRYELLGVILGLAVYNGITVPLSFPTVFYRKLLGLVTRTEDLEEGWPVLHQGLQNLLAYDGDVETDLVMSFSYHFAANGLHLDVDMTDPWASEGEQLSVAGTGMLRVFEQQQIHPVCKTSDMSSTHANGALSEVNNQYMPTNLQNDAMWPGWTIVSLEESGDAVSTSSKLIINANRQAYVDSYAKWVLDYSIRPQFYALARGFYKVVTPASLNLFRQRPKVLRSFIEGSEKLDMETLETLTVYADGYDAESDVVKWFWATVKDYPPERHVALLEFVTACPRMPAFAGGHTTDSSDETAEQQRRTRDLNQQRDEDGSTTAAPVFRIARASLDEQRSDLAAPLPRSSTCFRTLYLPEYPSREMLEAKLKIALEHSLGFGGA